jgi:hypothetical protein
MDEPDFFKIYGLYIITNPKGVSQMLGEIPGLASLLLEAKEKIDQIFGPASALSLDVVYPAGVPSEMELYIHTSLSVDESIAALDQLHESWWLDVMPRAEQRLTIQVTHVPTKQPTFARYQRKQIAELRPYVPGELLSRVSISEADKAAGSPLPGDMIARNPKNHDDQWLVSKAYFRDNFEPL